MYNNYLGKLVHALIVQPVARRNLIEPQLENRRSASAECTGTARMRSIGDASSGASARTSSQYSRGHTMARLSWKSPALFRYARACTGNTAHVSGRVVMRQYPTPGRIFFD